MKEVCTEGAHKELTRSTLDITRMAAATLGVTQRSKKERRGRRKVTDGKEGGGVRGRTSLGR